MDQAKYFDNNEESEDQQNKTVFSLEEKKMLENNWQVVKPYLQELSTDVFLRVFIGSENQFGKIRTPHGENYTIESLHSIPMDILKFFEKIIESGLDDVEIMKDVLEDVFQYYDKRNLNFQLIKILIETIRSRLGTILCRFSSCKFRVTLEKLCDLFLNDSEQNKM